jgi:KDEL-tailed cysteine endopeptidase
MLKSLISVLALITIVSCTVEVKKTILESFKDAPKKELFKVFHFLFEKNYNLNTEEGLRRYTIFKSNMKVIEKTNAQNLEYKFGVNQFTDLTPEEFKMKYLMKPEKKSKMVAETVRNLRDEGLSEDFFDLNADKDDEDVNDSQAYTPVDWRPQFLPPRNQGECGSCWSFASTAAIEAAYFKKTNVKEYLSTQQLVDCDINNNGCDGGNFFPALDYVKINGLLRDADYPYTGVVNTCNKIKISASIKKKITSYSYCSNYTSKNCSTKIVYSMLAQSPLMVGVDGSVIQYYSSGIFTGSCYEDNHAVVLVGYGVQNGIPFWIVRNSWGTTYGEKGYFRVRRNDANKNSCFLNNEALAVVA